MFHCSLFRNSKFFKLSVVPSLFLCATLFSLSGCGSSKAETPKTGTAPILQVEGFLVTEAPLQSTYQSSGTLLPNEEISVFAETPGRITHIYFKEGAFVKKGTLLVQLYDEDVRSQLQKLKAQKGLQLTTQKRQNELLEINGISRQEVDVTQTQIASIDADIALVDAQLRKLKIYAPFDGVIGLRNVSEGAIVNSASLITTIQQINPLKLDFALPVQNSKQVKVGSEVTFTVAVTKDILSGKVSAIQPAADASTRTITVRAIVSNSNGHLVPGSFADVSIPLSENSHAITIPPQAIIPTTRDSKVAILKNGKADLVTVKTGMRMSDKVEVTSGLNAGDTVITTGIMQVKSGMDVKITKMIN